MPSRCFLAVECTTDEIINKMRALQMSLKATQADIKCVEPENLHITLKFLGEVRDAQLDQLIKSVREVTVEPFQMMLTGLGVFPKLNRPRVVWVGVEKGATELTKVFSDVEKKLVKMGFETERRSFHPHLTVCRIRSGRNRVPLVEEIIHQAVYELGTVHVDKIVLKKSVLTQSGAIYTNLAESRTKPIDISTNN